jgi:hypothetical protein
LEGLHDGCRIRGGVVVSSSGCFVDVQSEIL